MRVNTWNTLRKNPLHPSQVIALKVSAIKKRKCQQRKWRLKYRTDSVIQLPCLRKQHTFHHPLNSLEDKECLNFIIT